MAEETAGTPGFDPGLCVLALRWNSRSSGMERAGCPFGACIQCAIFGVSGVSEGTANFLYAIQFNGCRYWRTRATLATEE
jgi:hypothetical protein